MPGFVIFLLIILSALPAQAAITCAPAADFPLEAAAKYREFIPKVLPLLATRLGEPQRPLFARLTAAPSRGYFSCGENGELITTDGSFEPKSFVHELVHSWFGARGIRGGLDRFEEALAEGVTYAVMEDYANRYPADPASLFAREWPSYSLWPKIATLHELQRHGRQYGATPEYSHNVDAAAEQYSVGATLFQAMLVKNPAAAREILADWLALTAINPLRLPTRAEVVAIWTRAVPELNGRPLAELLDIPYFKRSLPPGSGFFQSAYSPATGARQVSFHNISGSWQVSRPIAAPARVVLEDYDGTGLAEREFTGQISLDDWRPERLLPGLYRISATLRQSAEPGDFWWQFGQKGVAQACDQEQLVYVGVPGLEGATVQLELGSLKQLTALRSGAALFRLPAGSRGELALRVSPPDGRQRIFSRTLLPGALPWRPQCSQAHFLLD